MTSSQIEATGRHFFEHTGRPTLSAALADLRDGWGRRDLWASMAWEDVKQRYRGSVLGPFWVTITMGVMVGALGVIYGSIFGINMRSYLPSLTLGFLSWTLISTTINESTSCFVAAYRYVKQIRLPLSLFVYRLIMRNLLLLAHNFIVFVGVLVVFHIWPGWAALLALPGLALVVYMLFMTGFLFGMLGARFRDFPQIVVSVMQVIFYITPILWNPELLKGHVFVLTFNPVYYFIELIRRPLMGKVPPVEFYGAALLMCVLATAVVLPFLRKFRARIAYWV